MYITTQRVLYLVACLLVMVKLNGGLGIASLMDLPTIDDRCLNLPLYYGLKIVKIM